MWIRSNCEVLWLELRYAARRLGRSPGYALTTSLILGAGIGGVTVAFSAIRTMLLSPLPFQDADRLMKIGLMASVGQGVQASREMGWPYPMATGFLRQQLQFGNAALYSSHAFNVTDGLAERVEGEYVSGGYWSTLGVTPSLGRAFFDEEGRYPGGRRVVVIGNALWRRRFGASPLALGHPVTLDGVPYDIVGVAPAGFRGVTGEADLFVSLMSRTADDLGRIYWHEFNMVGRLRPGVTVAEATSAVALEGTRLNGLFPDPRGGLWAARAIPLEALRVSPLVRRVLAILFGSVAFALMIACATVANLQLGQAAVRGREIAIRTAVGASRARIVTLQLSEALILSGISGGIGALLAWWGTQALRNLSPVETLRNQRLTGFGVIGVSSVQVDTMAVLFLMIVAASVAVLFGLVPTLLTPSRSLPLALKERGGYGASRVGAMAGRRLLVVAEVGMALVLLLGSGLMIRSMLMLARADLGFDPQRVLTLRLTTPEVGTAPDALPALYAELLGRLRALPGVTQVSLGDCAPLAGGCKRAGIQILSASGAPDPTRGGLIGVHLITPDWPATLRVPLLRGRQFADTDQRGSPNVVLVNEVAAEAFWPGVDPVGKRISFMTTGLPNVATVVGVIGDIQYVNIDSMPQPDVYLPYNQMPYRDMMVFLKSAGSPGGVTARSIAVVRDLLPDVPVYDVRSLSSRISSSTAQRRLLTVVLTSFALFALALAVIGVYAVTSFGVTQRTHEIGIRMALGAERGTVLRMVLAEGAKEITIGVAIGLAIALPVTRALRSLLFGIKPLDAESWILAVVLLAVAGLFGTWLPARRASRVDPATALRHE